MEIWKEICTMLWIQYESNRKDAIGKIRDKYTGLSIL